MYSLHSTLPSVLTKMHRLSSHVVPLPPPNIFVLNQITTSPFNPSSHCRSFAPSNHNLMRHSRARSSKSWMYSPHFTLPSDWTNIQQQLLWM
jgi:hypothetical protein